MSKTSRELTPREKQRIKKLIVSECANYDKEYGCLPLDCDCPMFCIGFANSGLCTWFRGALLPTAPELQAVFEPQPLKVCKECGKHFPAQGKRAYCSKKCAETARRRQTAARVRKHREKQDPM